MFARDAYSTLEFLMCVKYSFTGSHQVVVMKRHKESTNV